MAYYSTHSISQFLLNNEKQRVQFLLAHPVYMYICKYFWQSVLWQQDVLLIHWAIAGIIRLLDKITTIIICKSGL